MNSSGKPRWRTHFTTPLAALLVVAALVFLAGCLESDSRMEEEYRKGYEAGKAATEAKMFSNGNGLTGEEAQNILSAVGEGKALRFEVREYSIEENACQAYGVLIMQDNSTKEFALVMERVNGIWRVTGLHEPGLEEGAQKDAGSSP